MKKLFLSLFISQVVYANDLVINQEDISKQILPNANKFVANCEGYIIGEFKNGEETDGDYHFMVKTIKTNNSQINEQINRIILKDMNLIKEEFSGMMKQSDGMCNIGGLQRYAEYLGYDDLLGYHQFEVHDDSFSGGTAFSADSYFLVFDENGKRINIDDLIDPAKKKNLVASVKRIYEATYGKITADIDEGKFKENRTKLNNFYFDKNRNMNFYLDGGSNYRDDIIINLPRTKIEEFLKY